MKKKIPKRKPRNIPFKIITVHSRAYGEHTRAARGSIKPAPLNDTLVRRSKELSIITAFASEVHTLLRIYAGNFKESMFWQNMLRCLHKVTDITPASMLKSCVGLELNSRYPLKRFGNTLFIHIAIENNRIITYLKDRFAPYFKKPVQEYCYDVIVLFFDRSGRTTGSEDARSRWMKYNEATGELFFTFTLPANSVFYLVCLRLHTGSDGVPTNGIMSQGMRVIESGEIINK